ESRSGRAIAFGAGRVFAVALFLVASSLLAAEGGLDVRKSFTQYSLDSWTTDDGLPNATVTAILQTRDGYVWVGTLDGLARFDGVRFTVFNKSNTEGIGNNGILSLCEDRDGALWIGTNGG